MLLALRGVFISLFSVSGIVCAAEQKHIRSVFPADRTKPDFSGHFQLPIQQEPNDKPSADAADELPIQQEPNDKPSAEAADEQVPIAYPWENSGHNGYLATDGEPPKNLNNDSPEDTTDKPPEETTDRPPEETTEKPPEETTHNPVEETNDELPELTTNIPPGLPDGSDTPLDDLMPDGNWQPLVKFLMEEKEKLVEQLNILTLHSGRKKDDIQKNVNNVTVAIEAMQDDVNEMQTGLSQCSDNAEKLQKQVMDYQETLMKLNMQRR